MVSITRERIRFAWLSICSFLPFSRRRVVPLYTQVDARWLTESWPGHKRVLLGDQLQLHYDTSHAYMAVYTFGP